MTIITPGDRIQVLAMPLTIHEGRHGTVETVQDLSRDSHQHLPMARITAYATGGGDAFNELRRTKFQGKTGKSRGKKYRSLKKTISKNKHYR